ncbi:MAG: zinc-ribbon domain-containing protein [Deltaproteobacteria bacterium]|nr:zinc-ribbon domain-containing protein [Deltaproteobacteria bacterium]
MIIQCDKCSTKFKLDESKITGKGIRVRCTKCQNVFAVTPPEAPVAPPPADEDIGFNAQGQEGASGGEGFDAGAGFDARAGAGEGFDAGAGGEGATGGDKDFTGFDVSAPTGQDAASQPPFGEQDFDFGAPPEGGVGASGGEQLAAGGTNEWSFDGAGGGTPGFDAGGGTESGAGDAFGGGAGFDVNENEGESEPPAYGGDDANAPLPQEEPFMQPPPQAKPPAPAGDDWQLGSAGEEGDVGETGPDGSAGDEGLTPGGAAGEAASSSESGALRAGMSDKDFAAGLSKSMEDESKSAVAEKKAAKKKAGAGASSKGAGLIPLVILIVIIIGALAWYFGIRGNVEQAAMVKTIDITSIDGRYDQTPNLGSFFVIEAKIKNITAVPQSVKAVTGIVYDAKGERLASMPGRVISSGDIKNLTKEDLAKTGNTGAVGTIPPKGTLPVVVIFTKTPEGMAEYSVEITP